MDILIFIKRLVIAHKIIITYKAAGEMDLDGITEDDVIASILNARKISKIINSTSAFRSGSREKLYIIKGPTFSDVIVYTKGTIRRTSEGYALYILISSKRSL